MKRIAAWLVEALGIRLVDGMGREERARHVRSTTTITILFGSAFALFNVSLPATRLLGFAELASIMLCFVPAALLNHQPRFIDAAESLLMLGTLCISSALIILGGVEGTGLLWVYCVPFLAFFIKGQRRGWHYSLAFLVWHGLCLWLLAPRLPQAYPYSPVLRLHFMLSMVFYVLVAAAFNHARSRFETALQQRQQEAEAASQAKSRFLAAASHDLRQPAHALGLFVARLRQLPASAQAQELVAGVDASVQALQDMLDAFFDYSRLDSQLTRAQLCGLPLNSVFDKLRTSFADTAAQKGLRLRVRPTTAWVHSDPVLLHRVLLNLLSNAVQHTPGGSVLLACRSAGPDGRLRIEVRDSGIGIAAEHQQKIFEEFYQVENPQRDRTKGLGLGLSIVARSCKLLDHRISLRSALGRGSTFCLHVAPSEALPQDPPDAAVDASPQHTLSGMRVLLIEDDALGRAALRELVQSWGCSVLEADSARAARALVAAPEPVDFIVTDYRLLGDENGVDTVHQLREIAGHAIPACVISGDTDTPLQLRIASSGLLLLQKPVKPARLRSVLRKARPGAQDA